eukprot:617323-Pelagomonas_calceolata.AAC.1
MVVKFKLQNFSLSYAGAWHFRAGSSSKPGTSANCRTSISCLDCRPTMLKRTQQLTHPAVSFLHAH